MDAYFYIIKKFERYTGCIKVFEFSDYGVHKLDIECLLWVLKDLNKKYEFPRENLIR